MKMMILLAAGMIAAGSAMAEECHVDQAQKNLVKFISEAPIEDFEGVTDRVDGYVLWEGAGLEPGGNYDSSEIYFEVELNGLDTGIGLRNRHMRENYLHTDKYPFAHFKGKIDSVEAGNEGRRVVRSSGMFHIHGIERALVVTATVTPQANGYRVETGFEVKLPDYGIEVPSLMFLKIGATQQVKLDFYLKIMDKQAKEAP